MLPENVIQSQYKIALKLHMVKKCELGWDHCNLVRKSNPSKRTFMEYKQLDNTIQHKNIKTHKKYKPKVGKTVLIIFNCQAWFFSKLHCFEFSLPPC